MQAFIHLAHEEPLVLVHLLGALGGLLLGGVLLSLRKGNTLHRTLGWTWVVLMGTAAVSSAFMPSVFPNIGGFGPIHALTLLTLVMLPMGVWQARHGRVQFHRRTMLGIYIGGCVVAGAFTLMPGRFLGRLLWG